jgi:hypothetical protein
MHFLDLATDRSHSQPICVMTSACNQMRGSTLTQGEVSSRVEENPRLLRAARVDSRLLCAPFDVSLEVLACLHHDISGYPLTGGPGCLLLRCRHGLVAVLSVRSARSEM